MWCWKKEINFEADFELNNFGFNVDEAHSAFGKEVEWANFFKNCFKSSDFVVSIINTHTHDMFF